MAIRIEHVGDVAIVIAEGVFKTKEQANKLDAALKNLIVEQGRKTLLNMICVQSMNSVG